MIRVRLLVKTDFRFSLKCSLKVDNSGDSVGGRGNWGDGNLAIWLWTVK